MIEQKRINYRSIHAWVKRLYGKPQHCENCGTTEAPENRRVAIWFQWANISHEYKRERSDWKRLCYPCHKQMDEDFRAKYPHFMKVYDPAISVAVSEELHTKAKTALARDKKTFIEFITEKLQELVDKED